MIQRYQSTVVVDREGEDNMYGDIWMEMESYHIKWCRKPLLVSSYQYMILFIPFHVIGLILGMIQEVSDKRLWLSVLGEWVAILEVNK